MSQEQAAFSFELNESLFFRQGQEVAEMVGISLEPIITIYPYEDYVQLRGVIELKGEYKIDENGHTSYDPLEEAERQADRLIESVQEISENELGFAHRFPVEISIPTERITDLEEVKVQIESFDYLFPTNDQLRLQAVVQILGIQPEASREVERPQEELDLPWPFFGADEENADTLESLMGKLTQFDDDFPEEKDRFEFEVVLPQETEEADANDHETLSETARAPEDEASTDPVPQQEEVDPSAAYEENTHAEASEAVAEDRTQPAESSLSSDHVASNEQVEAKALAAEKQAEAQEQSVPQSREEDSKKVNLEKKQVAAEEETPEVSRNNQDDLAETEQEAEVQEAETKSESETTITAEEESAESEPERPETEPAIKAEAEPTRSETKPAIKAEAEAVQATPAEEVSSVSQEQVEQPKATAANTDKPHHSAKKRTETGIHAQEPDEEGADLGNLTDLFGGDAEESYTQMRLYIVQERDTLETIAERYEIPITKLLQHNRLETENIGAGQLIYIPYSKETKA